MSTASDTLLVTMIRPVVAMLCGVLLLGQGATALAQGSDNDNLESATEIEPYDGPPIFLPEVETPPPPSEVESKVIKQNYEDSDTPRFERRVVRYSDESLKSDGPMKEYFTNGQLFVEGQYDTGKPTGKWTYYHKNGQLAKEITYNQGRPEGVVQYYNEEGQLVSQRQYAEGKRDGTWKMYDPETEQVLREESYSEGKASGEWRTFYKNGQLRQQTSFVGGRLDGVAKEWTKLGEQRAVAEFKEGKRHGKTTLYQTDGTIIERLYDDGQLVDQSRKQAGAS